MKFAVAALLGVVSCTTAIPDTQLVRINTSAYADSKSIVREDEDEESEESSGSDDGSGSEESGDDELVQTNDPCVYLDETQDELDYQIDMFSRTLDVRHWTNA
jgi:hypothetical protein